jgi:transposase InsO family protein
MTGLPRRVCAAIKKREVRELEIERKARCASVVFAAPGIVRGFDAMHVESTAGRAYWLVAADAAVPFRTSILTVPVYDAEHVIAALTADFDTHGAPLVLRLDRIACQRTAEVDALLARYQVLALHGPPRHPYYYGQLERQNREHRAWYALLGIVEPAALAVAGEEMRTTLNTLWPRPTLAGCTAEQAWRARKPPDVDRRTLITDVDRRAFGLVASGIDQLRARRIAIEAALTERGLLTVNQGGWC